MHQHTTTENTLHLRNIDKTYEICGSGAAYQRPTGAQRLPGFRAGAEAARSGGGRAPVFESGQVGHISLSVIGTPRAVPTSSRWVVGSAYVRRMIRFRDRNLLRRPQLATDCNVCTGFPCEIEPTASTWAHACTWTPVSMSSGILRTSAYPTPASLSVYSCEAPPQLPQPG
jgi:hypothetical protein